MYAQTAFREERLPVLHAAIARIGFASLVTNDEGGLTASHLPLHLEAGEGPRGVLYGHMARANPQWKNAEGSQALALFQGPQAYVTPSWYETKKQTGKAVPTWNYIALQAHGRFELLDDPRQALDVVSRQTDHHEAGRTHPWAVSDAPDDYLQALLKTIVAFRLTIARLDGVWKLSQNRSPEDRAGVIGGLVSDGQAALAASMRDPA